MNQRAKEGYLLIDHRNSPGIPGAPKILETATFCCSHCSRIVLLGPTRTRPLNYCAKCDHYICDGCKFLDGIKAYHVPIVALIDELDPTKFEQLLAKREL